MDVLGRRLIVLSVLTLVALFGMAWIASHAAHVMAESEASLDRTRAVLLAIDTFRAALAEAESGERGYVITADPSLRDASLRAAQSARVSLTGLKAVVSNTPEQRVSLAAFDALVEARLDHLRTLISLEDRRASQADVDRNVAGGTRMSRNIASALSDIRSKELHRFQLLASRAANAQRYALYGPWVMCVIAGIIFASMLKQVVGTLRLGSEMRENLQKVVSQERAARERADEADKLKDQFLAAVSHELRTPLTSIIGWCDLLRDEKMQRTLLNDGLANIAHAARVQSQLVEDLLDASRITAGTLQLYFSEVSPADVIERAIASVAPTAHAKKITVRKHVPSEPALLLADATRLEQIVWNLLTNAIKFSPENGVVDVALRRSQSHVEIIVADNGQGIAADLLPHIFDRFRQGHATGIRQSGLGLGLAIVKTLVELHHGTVRAESAGVGAGATFIVELPLAGARQSAPLTSNTPDRRQFGRGPSREHENVSARVRDVCADVATKSQIA